jgi:hypothetical protein
MPIGVTQPIPVMTTRRGGVELFLIKLKGACFRAILPGLHLGSDDSIFKYVFLLERLSRLCS